MTVRLVALVLVALLVSGCRHSFDATRLGVPVTMASEAGSPPEGEAFKVNGTVVHGLLGLFTITQPSLDKVLARQLVGGKAVSNLRIRVRSRWTDLLVTGLTLGLVIPRTVTFDGVVTGGPTP